MDISLKEAQAKNMIKMQRWGLKDSVQWLGMTFSGRMVTNMCKALDSYSNIRREGEREKKGEGERAPCTGRRA